MLYCYDHPSMFRAIERDQTLTGRVSSQVEQLILGSHLRPGDKLPAERDLADRFQVSRTVVREAIRSLAARGMVDVQQGKGTMVSTPSLESLAQPMALILRSSQGELEHHKVMEVRRLLEVEIVALAAARRTDSDIQRMEEILENRAEIHSNRQVFLEWDMGFHAALAQSTQNELFSLLLNSVASVLRQIREVGFDVPGTPDRALLHHQNILAAVKSSNVVEARRAMQEHMNEAQTTLLRSLELRLKNAE
ncbi:MAG: FadR/GntR family transcriptional regulator [Verrucomicrobiota bacterium]|nr:FadR/GntR family transcriptional regulator [Verrucomicrobiota bacterium]